MMSHEDYDNLQETMYLLSSPNNASRLMASIAEYEAGKVIVTTANSPKELSSLDRS